MCATKVTAATLVNTVQYVSDKTSLKKVRKEMKDLQTQMSKSMSGTGSPAAARQSVKAARQSAAAIMDAQVKAYQDVSKERSKQMAKNAQNNINALLGIDKVKKSARDSANVFKAAFANESDLAKKQTEQMNQYNKQMLGQQANIDKIRKDALAARDKQQKRDRNANRISNDFAFEVGRLKLTASETANAAREMESLNKRYREGSIELADYRQQQRHMLRNLRDQSKESMTLGERLRELREGKSGGLGRGGLLLGLGIAGTIGAGYMAYGKGREALSSGVEQSRGLSRVNTMGLSTAETQALQMAALQATGFNLSYEKISDIAKDTQDKVGQLSQGQWKQNAKTGQWNFSGGGELSDWLNIMTTRGGYSREGAVSTLQSAKGPVEFALILENLRKQAKLTDQEFTALSESINDFSYITKSIGPEAQNVTDAMAKLAEQGLLYTQQEQDNLKELSNLSAVYSAVTDILQGKFASAFVTGMQEAGVNSSNLAEELAKTGPVVKQLGEFAGETAVRFLQLINALPQWSDSVFGTRQIKNQSGWYYDDSALGNLINGTKSFFGVDTGANWTPDQGFNTQSVMNDRYNNLINTNPYGFSGGSQQSSTLNLQLQISPNADEFRNAFDVHAQDAFDTGIDNMTWDINQSLLKY